MHTSGRRECGSIRHIRMLFGSRRAIGIMAITGNITKDTGNKIPAVEAIKQLSELLFVLTSY
jgi:hypothetical protein